MDTALSGGNFTSQLPLVRRSPPPPTLSSKFRLIIVKLNDEGGGGREQTQQVESIEIKTKNVKTYCCVSSCTTNYTKIEAYTKGSQK